MDAYYASVEVRDHPVLRGKPVLVGGSPRGRGVVAAANYEAREFGIHSAMPSARAKRLCPDAIFVKPRHDYYAEISRQIRSILDRYTPLVEPLALDEAFLDVTASRNLYGDGANIGRAIKREIREQVGLVASVGVAPNKYLAKLASDFGKPDGFVVIPPEQAQQFLDPLPVSRLWGVGKSADRALTELGITTIAQLRKVSPARLEQRFGDWAHHLRQLACGIDKREVVSDRDAKSMSHETTFENDMNDVDALKSVLLELTEQLAHRLRGHQRHAGNVEIKVRFSDFNTITRSRRLSPSTDVTKQIWEIANRLLIDALQSSSLKVRLLGVGVSAFDHDPETQLVLFKDVDAHTQSRLDRVADQIRNRFGAGTIRRGWRSTD